MDELRYFFAAADSFQSWTEEGVPQNDTVPQLLRQLGIDKPGSLTIFDGPRVVAMFAIVGHPEFVMSKQVFAAPELAGGDQ